MSNVLARAVVKIEGDISDLKAAFDLAEEEMDKAGKTMGKVGKELTTHLTLPLLALGGLAVHEFAQQEDALARLRGVIASTGGVSGVTAEHVKTLAESLEKTTTFADDVTESAAAVLLTFQAVRNEVGKGNDVFDRTIKAGQGLAEIMGGDLQGAYRRLGLALEDPTAGLTMLRKTGVNFTDQEEEQIKALAAHGHALEAQRMILDKVEKKFGSVAEAMARTPLGQMKQAWNQLGNAMEEAGKVLAPIVTLFAGKIKGVAVAFQGWSDSQKALLIGMLGAVAAMGPMLLGFSAILKVLAALKVAGLEVSLAFRAITAGSVLLVGLGLLAAAWLKVRMEVEKVEQATADATAKMQTFLASFTPAHAAKTVARLDAGILKTATDRLEQAKKNLATELATPTMTAQGGFDPHAHQQRVEALQAEIAETQALVDSLNRDKATLTGVSEATTTTTVATFTLNDTMKEFRAGLAQTNALASLLGPTYDKTSEQADLYRGVIEKLISQGAKLNTVVGPHGQTLGDLVEIYKALNKQIADATEREKFFEDQQQLVDDAIKATQTSLDIYHQTIDALNGALIMGTISEGLYVAAVKAARQAYKDSLPEAEQLKMELQDLGLSSDELTRAINATQDALNRATAEMDDMTAMSDQLRQALHDMVGRAVDAFIDMAATGKESFGEFVRSALADLGKLILKLELMRLLVGSKEHPGLLGNLIGFASGGFLQPGEIGLVGETGPELVSGGRAGLTIKPLSADRMPAGGAGGGGDTVHVAVQVAAVDAQGVNQFFQQNEGLVANAMLRAFQRSRILRNRLGG